MFRHLLVPTDGSDLSDGTIRRAVSFAREAGASITFLHVLANLAMPPQGSLYGDPVLLDPTVVAKFSQAERSYAAALLERARALAEKAGVPCDTAVGDHPVVYEAIIEAATSHGCDLIFMASHGRRGLAGLLLGSETQQVLTHTDLPVLVFRRPEPAAGSDQGAASAPAAPAC
ncbi:universal stress protein [Cyanobium sp. Cruz CV13-4-11]|jgi:nucleotide-binding universal stress UspA family protein|uniref:universal stress protein n=1 Tax=unclassified Cyanobium TaxID=2627006 RepID=UPI0020CF006F|nr:MULTISPECIES: universal stress protein [unclassified Cyanobium]MCP9900729.1 universal stress protein [Cyanobium sp. Cruz CV11-17]MCP9919766.1 universal stress protein [Cyanobium sp. Cruz CV13-4-11]